MDKYFSVAAYIISGLAVIASWLLVIAAFKLKDRVYAALGCVLFIFNLYFIVLFNMNLRQIQQVQQILIQLNNN